MNAAVSPVPKLLRRNKGFDETHREMIDTAVRLISESGIEALSIAALSRAMGINRTTVYYHFDSREALIAAVKTYATAELAKGMDLDTSARERGGNVTRFVLENPELIKLWIEDFVSGKDIRDVYPRWDAFVAGIAEQFEGREPEIDAEVYCTMLLAAAIVGARVYANSVRPGASVEATVASFLKEEERAATRDGLSW